MEKRLARGALSDGTLYLDSSEDPHISLTSFGHTDHATSKWTDKVTVARLTSKSRSLWILGGGAKSADPSQFISSAEFFSP